MFFWQRVRAYHLHKLELNDFFSLTGYPRVCELREGGQAKRTRSEKGLMPEAVYEDMTAALAEDANTCARWSAELKWVMESLEYDPFSGRPVTATTPEMMWRIHDVLIAVGPLTQLACCRHSRRRRGEESRHYRR